MTRASELRMLAEIAHAEKDASVLVNTDALRAALDVVEFWLKRGMVSKARFEDQRKMLEAEAE